MTNNLDEKEKPGKPQKTVVREYTEALLIALVLALLIRTFIIQAFKIPTGSMEPTLLVGDHLLVSKFSYGIHIPNEIPFTSIQLFPDYHLISSIPQRGDIIVFKFPLEPEKDFIKRVIGLPGETLHIVRQKVYINGKPLKEPYAHHSEPPGMGPPNRDDLAPVLIPEGHVFVMGDNRENSHDSRMWGVLDLKNLRGKAQWIYWSWNSHNSGVRWDRLGDSVYQ
ncbi:MAG: signal peptidase I [Nitrospinaceae bacterium]|nr:signal peptidase I [Nitrospinaceae bacterium]NIR53859.1 signal peptidase I [Nitrospinaceae bacterium]NIS84273.1 signal peptidase I [Nitrospinaceae bacterium]NIT81080.1 signal peptidase I [Nitrospinaceae bacterium]NIU43362.1 signal peptidase I [Nitrospinaceae bacterium]